MKKYRLTKDLPFAKAGTEIEYDKDGYKQEHPQFYICSLEPDDPKTYWVRIESDTEDFDKMISEGWIEEVKPREFWLGMDNDGGQRIYGDISEISDTWDDLIHVQEID